MDPPFEESPYWPTLRLYRVDTPAIGKALMTRTRRYKYVQRLYDVEELYDLERDPQEVTNLIHDPAFADVLAALRERTMRFHLETADVVPREVNAREASPDHLERVERFNRTYARRPAPTSALIDERPA